MATSGNTVVTVTSYDNLKFSWWRDSYSIAGNYTDIGWKMELIASNYGAISSSTSKSWSVNVNGSTYSGTNTIGIGNNQTKTLASGTTRVYHNADGTKSFNYSFSQQFDINFNGWIGTKSGSGSGTLDTIPRYTSITSFTVAKRSETSVTYNFTTADTCDYVWYSKDNGSTWAGVDIADGTSGSFNVTGLSANTTYKFKLRVRRKDSQLTTDSGTVQQTTYKVPTQSLNNKTETRIVMNWSIDSTADHIWYSTNNGSNWTDAGSVNATSGTVTINSLSPNTAYNVRLRIRRKASQTTYDISATNITTYKAPTQSLNSKTETTIKMNWSCDSTVSKVEYSKDNGSTWTTVTNDANATSGNYTISNLTANTSYNIKTRLTRKATNTNYSTGATAVTTYNYPYCTEAPDFTIGNNVTVKLYNPLNRTVKIQMWSHVSRAFVSDLIEITGTSYTGFSNVASRLYASIPNNTESQYNIDVWYGDNKATKSGGKYKIVGTENPTFSNFTYKDSNTVVAGVTGNDQVMVKGLSTVQVTISSANKMTAKNSATGKNYSMSMSGLSASENYSTSDIIKELGTINATGTQRLSVTAYDSRGLATTVSRDITVYNYTKPVINATAKRLNDFENQTTIQVSGTYTKLAINNVNKNSITGVAYRYRETGESWSEWIALNTTVNNGTFTCSSVTRDLDNTKSYEIQIRATDTLQQTTTNTYKVDIGKAILLIKRNGGIEVNGNSTVKGNLSLAEGKQIDNGDSGLYMLKDHNNTNVTVNATGGVLYLGFVNTTGLNILNGKATMDSTGNMLIKSDTANHDVQYVAKRADTNTQVWLGVGSGGINHGVFSNKLNKWILYADDTSVYVNGVKDDHGTANTTDTWIPVYSNNKLQHANRIMWSSKQHSNYNTNQSYIATLSCLSWWNGAYNGNNNSNLTYAHQGTIQCKPTTLYDNNSGTTGTVTLSQTAANFTYLEIFYKKSDIYSSTTVYSPNEKSANLNISYLANSTTYQNIGKVVKISGTSITKTSEAYNNVSNGATGVIGASNNEIYITKVIGYK